MSLQSFSDLADKYEETLTILQRFLKDSRVFPHK